MNGFIHMRNLFIDFRSSIVLLCCVCVKSVITHRLLNKNHNHNNSEYVTYVYVVHVSCSITCIVFDIISLAHKILYWGV